jgi:hypothetical protein
VEPKERQSESAQVPIAGPEERQTENAEVAIVEPKEEHTENAGTDVDVRGELVMISCRKVMLVVLI